MADQRSTNGVLVNGAVLVSPRRLKNDDLIQISRTVFQVMLLEPAISVFISYGGPDHDFAQRLHDLLVLEGLEVFFFPETAQERAMGQHIWRVTRREVAARDILILVCSKDGLNRPGLLAELQHLLAKEEGLGGHSLMVPLTLDDYVYSWRPADSCLADAVRERV